MTSKWTRPLPHLAVYSGFALLIVFLLTRLVNPYAFPLAILPLLGLAVSGFAGIVIYAFSSNLLNRAIGSWTFVTIFVPLVILPFLQWIIAPAIYPDVCFVLAAIWNFWRYARMPAFQSESHLEERRPFRGILITRFFIQFVVCALLNFLLLIVLRVPLRWNEVFLGLLLIWCFSGALYAGIGYWRLQKGQNAPRASIHVIWPALLITAALFLMILGTVG